MEESGEDTEEIIKYLDTKIKQLKKEISILEEIRNKLQGIREETNKESMEKEPSSVKVITFKGKVLADVVETADGIKIILTESIPMNSSVVKAFLLKFLEDKVKNSEINSYNVVERKGYIAGIEVSGKPPRRFLKDLELALKYVWSEIGKEE